MSSDFGSSIDIPIQYISYQNYSQYQKENIDPSKFFEKWNFQVLLDDINTGDCQLSSVLRQIQKQFLDEPDSQAQQQCFSTSDSEPLELRQNINLLNCLPNANHGCKGAGQLN